MYRFLLNRPISDKPTSNRLPLPLNRPLGELGEVMVTPMPIDPPKPPNPFGRLVAMAMDIVVEQGRSVGNCQAVGYRGDGVANLYDVQRTDGLLLTSCQTVFVKPFTALVNGGRSVVTDGILLANKTAVKIDKTTPVFYQTTLPVSKTVSFRTCSLAFNQAIEQFYHCQTPFVQGVKNYQNCIRHRQKSELIGICQTEKVSPSVGVPCRYYPIPEPPPKPLIGRCRIRPPSNRLPLNLTRQRGHLPSSALPLTLICWHDNAPDIIANLRSYIVKNTISATLGGIEIDPLSFTIKTDMNGYCWRGSLELSPSQYAKVKQKLDIERGLEPLITVNINGHLFSMIAEDVSRSRAFVNHWFSISGRSATARLGADYAKAQTSVVNLDNYASQLINSQLSNLPFSVGHFEMTDWFIPANSYAISNKTPIAVIHDVVNACGGFMWSDAHLPKLYLQKKWKVNAWELATANPDVVLSVDVVKSIHEQKRVNPRYNTVTLIGKTQGGEVYRERQGRELIAPIETSDLFTDRDCFIQKGQQLLSDSGTHADYQIVMRWADKYNIKLAQLGQIWQINDPEGAFKGVVTSVAVDVKLENDVPTVWQTVELDRYLDI